MKINAYSFGSMTVDGKRYDADLIVFPDKVRSNWWRKEGHSLSIGDLGDVLEYGAEVLVIGQGHSSCMEVPTGTREALQRECIQVIASDTGTAWQVFNEQIRQGKKTVGAFHLTC